MTYLIPRQLTSFFFKHGLFIYFYFWSLAQSQMSFWDFMAFSHAQCSPCKIRPSFDLFPLGWTCVVLWHLFQRCYWQKVVSLKGVGDGCLTILKTDMDAVHAEGEKGSPPLRLRSLSHGICNNRYGAQRAAWKGLWDFTCPPWWFSIIFLNPSYLGKIIHIRQP